MCHISTKSARISFKCCAMDFYGHIMSKIDLVQKTPPLTPSCGDINIPMFQLFIVLADCTIIIGSDSDPCGLLVVSNPSDAISTSPRLFLLIFTQHSHFTNNNIVLCSPHLHETLYHFNLTLTSFPLVHRLYISHIDLDTPRSTSLLRYFVVLARILSISLRSRSIFHYIHQTSYTDLSNLLHSLSDHFRIKTSLCSSNAPFIRLLKNLSSAQFCLIEGPSSKY